MPKNTGLPYEQLAQNIFDQIVNQDRVETIAVEQDVILQGKTVAHQIDVYWKFEQGGIEHQVVVQAKDWASAVKQEQLFAFNSVLSDLPGQPRGVFVTRTGYQSGAKQFAEAHGIKLFELREPTESDREGWFESVTIRLTAYVPRSSDWAIEHDQEWAGAEAAKLGSPSGGSLAMTFDGGAPFVSQDGRDLGTLQSIIGSYPKDVSELHHEMRHEFDEETYLVTQDPRVPRLKVDAVTWNVTVHTHETETTLQVGDAVGFILRDVLGDRETIFDKSARLRPPTEG